MSRSTVLSDSASSLDHLALRDDVSIHSRSTASAFDRKRDRLNSTANFELDEHDAGPGAYAIAPGMAPSLQEPATRTIQPEEASLPLQQHSSNNRVEEDFLCEPHSSTSHGGRFFKWEASRKKKIWIAAGIALVLIAVGVVVVVGAVVLVGGNEGDSQETNVPQQPELCRFNKRRSPPLEHSSICRHEKEVVVPACAVTAYQDLLESSFSGTLSHLNESIATRQEPSDPVGAIRTTPCNHKNLALVRMAMALASNPNIRRLDYFLLSLFHLSIVNDDASLVWKDNDEYDGEWLSPFVDPCSWFGVACDTDDTNASSFNATSSIVSKIMVDGNNKATGSIPTEICFLTNLEVLKLGVSPISGPLPSEIGTCPKLRELDLLRCRLSGSIPTEIGSLSLLERLMIWGPSSLSGTIPSEIGNCTNLRFLDLAQLDMVSGTLPSELGMLSSSLTSLNVRNVFLDPALIPRELFRLSNLVMLELVGLELTGTITTEIGRLEKLGTKNFNGFGIRFALLSHALFSVWFHIGQQELVGPIPTQVGNLTNLETFDVTSNDLTGTLASEFGQCTRLKTLSLGLNLLQGVLPTELGLLTELTKLSLELNSITGKIPEEVCSLVSNNRLEVIADYCTLISSTPGCISEPC